MPLTLSNNSNNMISVSVVENDHYFITAIRRCLDCHDLFFLKGFYYDTEAALVGLMNDFSDVIIIEVKVPRMGGIELISRLSGLLPRSCFLVHTVYEDEETILKAFRAGAIGYLLKTTSCEGINASIIELYNGGAPMSPNIARKVVQHFKIHQPGSCINGLTSRENEVLKKLSEGLLYKEIATHLDISVFTVKNHLKKIYAKLQVQNKVEAINKYRQ